MGAISSNQIKFIRSLADKKFRDEYGLFTVEGEKMVSEALASPFTVEQVYRRDEIGVEAMSRISQLSSPSPVLAVVRKADNDCVHPGIPSKGLFLGLDSIRDPGNLGTILRIADWYGMDGVFATRDTVDLYNPKVVQATMGAIFRVKYCTTDLPALCGSFAAAGGKVYGTFLDGWNIYERELACGDGCPVLVLTGNESRGISPEVDAQVSDRLYLPPYPPDSPGSESLNAAVATALTVAEFRRRLSYSTK